MDIIPLYCSDGNLRSHKEGSSRLEYHYDDHSLVDNIVVTKFTKAIKVLMIFGKERNKVFKQIKQDNHSQNEDLKNNQ